MPELALSAGELHELLAMYREHASETWNFFLSVQFALIGFVYFTRDMPAPFFSRILLVAPYGAFMFMNYRAQVDNYAITVKISEIINEDFAGTRASQLVGAEGGWIVQWLDYIYLVAGGLGAVLLLFPMLFVFAQKD